ncbi:hypothetical protein RHSIM_Rhsim09G0201500 [Rhododendron simsii]|uniref:Uncharacterized protein n=1 Tax=Rhododendron simsii TaxID=118357 RepID=A0A834LGC8_RHOSS|nr:hypothetical protein RHSIM_Rhsim09G0201500 [Rhododendron simsii]
MGSADTGNLGVPQLPGQGCSFHSFRTNTYKLSFMESPSGIKVSEFHVDYDVLSCYLSKVVLRDPFLCPRGVVLILTRLYPYLLCADVKCSIQCLIRNTLVFYPSLGVSHLIPMVELAKLIVTHHPSFSVTILITTATKPDNSTATDNQSCFVHHSCHHLPPPPSPDSTL